VKDAQRRREIRDYYLGISADEITSYLTPASSRRPRSTAATTS
jgi:hypothetical protein